SHHDRGIFRFRTPTPSAYIIAMPWTPAYLPTTLKERFDHTIRKLRETMAIEAGRLGVPAILLFLIDARLMGLVSRIAAAITRGPIPRPHRPPNPNKNPQQSPQENPNKNSGQHPAHDPSAAPPARPTPRWLSRWPVARFGPPPRLSRAFGLLRRTFPHSEINGYIAKIGELLILPEMRALIETNPGLSRTLRPLCHLCGINPPASLQRPSRPRQPRPRSRAATRPRPTRTSPTPQTHHRRTPAPAPGPAAAAPTPRLHPCRRAPLSPPRHRAKLPKKFKKHLTRRRISHA
ncbi:hypothetical protein, partial [Acidiphilium sp.]|uniref:hypothetical protein n=1 Tax=Acidiphilium sp. TaxID=527 RepID=UPI003D07EDBF